MFDRKKFYIILMLLITASCVQDGVDIVYKENNKTKTSENKEDLLQPSYMRGTYIKTSNNKVVRDIRKEKEVDDEEIIDNRENTLEEENIEYNETKKDYNSYNIKNNNSSEIKKQNKQIITIKVKSGDSLLSIASKYNMSLKEIAELNKIRKPYNIYVGQKIKVYSNNIKTDTKKVEYKIVTVKKGDNLLKIALKNNSTLREIATINDIKPPYKVYVGQKIKVPFNETLKIENNNNFDNKKEKTKNYYIVKKGDNLYSISKNNKVSVNKIIKNNNLKKPYNIYVGQKLYLNDENIEKNNKQQNLVKNNNIKKNNTVINTNNDLEIKSNTSNTNITKEQTNKNSMFLWPVKGEIIKHFGKQANGESSDAIHIKARQGQDILASNSGEVVYAGNELKGYGNIIIIKHDNGWLSIYGYCDTMNVRVKDKVIKGQKIGTVGKTGSITEPQLYFSIRKGKVAMDPTKYLDNN